MSRGRREVTLGVDPGMVEAASGVPRDVYGDLDRLVRPDLRHHYATPLGAQRWLDVCADPGYGHATLLTLVDQVLPGVVDALREDGAGPALSLVSLGPGDGSVDERILKGLSERLSVDSYLAVDSSLELLRRSLRRIAHAGGGPDGLRIHGLLGDIRTATALPVRRERVGAPHLLVLTGFTLGNYPEPELVGGIRNLMGSGDYLLLDARLHHFGPLPEDLTGFREANGKAFRSYDLPSVRRFVFGPVEVATTACVSDVDVDFDVTRSVTCVPNALNLLIHCTDLRTVVRLTEERVQRDRLDLAVTTLYHLPDLLRWLDASGLGPIWHRSTDEVAFLLVKPRA